MLISAFIFDQRLLKVIVTQSVISQPLFWLYNNDELVKSYNRNSRWRHQMEPFSALLAICARNSPVPGEFPAQCQWRGALMFYLICVWINGWVNNGEAGDLRRYRAHYDVIVM